MKKPGEVEADVDSCLIRFSAALATSDTAQVRTLAGNNFCLLEEGQVYDLTSTLTSMLGELSTGTLIRTPYDFHTEVRGNFAYSHYSVKGELRSKEGVMALSLLETAVLERIDKQWLVVQMSSQQAHSAKK